MTSVSDRIGGTVRQRAMRELRDRILTGALPAGTRLDLDEIGAEFGVSRTPVREALLELSFFGLVQILPRSGITVIGVTPGQALDNFSIFAALSGKAAELAAVHITTAKAEALAELAAPLLTGAEPAELVDANWRFHRAINAAADSPLLITLIRHSVRLIPSNFLAVLAVEDSAEKEHALLLQHIRRGNARQARAVAEKHVLEAGEALAARLATAPATIKE